MSNEPSLSTTSPSTPPVTRPARPTEGLHHAAYACRDIDATHHFYEDLMGFHLIETEVSQPPTGGFLRHTFYDLGDGSCIAFFDLHGVGEREGWRSDISKGNGLPVWVNHIAFRSTAEQQEAVRARMDAEHVEPLMEIDHGWCHSLYYLDPNGIMVELCRDTPGITPDHERALARLHSDELHSDEKVITT